MDSPIKALSSTAGQLQIDITDMKGSFTLASIWFFCGIAYFSTPVMALEFECEIPNDTRYLKVEIPGEEHLCEVSVTYAQSGVREVKWYAQNDTLFCSARAYELRKKYEQAWNYTCTTWPDRDGIDKLSQSQRQILDQRLKSLMSVGQESTPAYRITGVKAVASTPLDNESGKLALQFFTDLGDFTEIVDDDSSAWTVLTTIDDMAAQVLSDVPVSSALVHSINDAGTLEVHTRLTDADSSECFGTQILTPVGSSGVVKARTPHRFICQSGKLTVQGSLNSLTGDSNETATR